MAWLTYLRNLYTILAAQLWSLIRDGTSWRPWRRG